MPQQALTRPRIALAALALGLTGLLLAPLTVLAEVQTKAIEYQDGDARLKGWLAWDDSIEGPRPAVLVAHEWWGLNEYAKQRAEMLAELGYVAFALDMYGDDKVTEHAKDAKGWMEQIAANTDAWQARAKAGLEVLKAQPDVDPERIAAVGYCFGGSTVMQLAYAGAPLAGVVSFHGALPPAPAGVTVSTPVLVAHGEADPMVPPERVAAFKKALDAAGADWQFIGYSGALHAFTNPNADEYGIEGLKYDEDADRRSWEAMQAFLDEVFGNDEAP